MSSNIEAYKKQLTQLVENSELNSNYPDINHHWQYLLQNAIDAGNERVLKVQKRQLIFQQYIYIFIYFDRYKNNI